MRRHPAPFGCRNFNPRIPYGMRPPARIMAWCSTNFNPRIPYGMRPDQARLDSSARISIHASRMGCDLDVAVRLAHGLGFQSTHPVWDATISFTRAPTRRKKFQSTHPVWDATWRECRQPSSWNFNPRIPYGMRLNRRCQLRQHIYFNPRIPYGMRPLPAMASYFFKSFQSTHPVWDATWRRLYAWPRIDISIHASRMGCDRSR